MSAIITPTRRGFLGLLGLGIAAPAIVRAESIMRVRPLVPTLNRSDFIVVGDAPRAEFYSLTAHAGDIWVAPHTHIWHVYDGRRWRALDPLGPRVQIKTALDTATVCHTQYPCVATDPAQIHQALAQGRRLGATPG